MNKDLIEQILMKHLANDAIDMLKINIEDLSKEIVAALKAREWQDIETAPKYKKVLICGGKTSQPWDAHHWFDEGVGCNIRTAIKNGRGYFEGEDNGYKFLPTHWMPLPTPPTKGSE